MRMFLISNMYPSLKDSLFGVFVKNFRIILEKKGVDFSAVSIIKGKRPNNVRKLISYFKYYCSISYNFIFKKYDLIYVHFMSHNAPVLALLFFFFKKRNALVMNVHGDDVTISKGKKIDILNKFVLKRTDLVVTPSPYFKEMMLTNYPFLKSERIFVSPSAGVDGQQFYPSAKPVNDKPILGMVSRIDEGKGWDDFLKALKILKDRNIYFKAIIAGQGLQENDMKLMIEAFGLQKDIEFFGLVEQQQLVHLYNQMEVMVFPTKREAESLGLVGLEAMRCKTPVIGGDIGGLKTYIENDENGMLFPPGNFAELAICIEKYLNFSEEEKEKMRISAFETSNQYESEYVMQTLLDELKKVCAKN